MSPLQDLRTLFTYRIPDSTGCLLAITLAREDGTESTPQIQHEDAPQLLRHAVTRLAASNGLMAIVHPVHFDYKVTNGAMFVEFFWICAPDHIQKYTGLPQVCNALEPRGFV